MDRKEKCDAIILTKQEKKLLKRISHSPHLKCDKCAVQPLYDMGLVAPDEKMVDGFGCPVPTDTYCVTDFYFVYDEFCREKQWLILTQGFWLPFGVSVVTNLISVGIQWLLRLR